VQVEQVVANLALNARDAMPGGGRLRIELSRRTLKEGEPPPVAGMTPGEWAALSVADTGFGMSPAVQRRLFEPFFSTKAGRGTGQAWGLRVRHGDEIALVLTDLVLPGVGGAHLCSALARQGRAPVIALSGYPIDAEDSRLAGVAHRLQKPVGIERLAQVIHRT